MAEIKSTLDLVMERTRHLSLSREERDAGKSKEFSRKINGRAQQFEDGQLRFEEVLRDIGRLQDEYAMTDPALVVRALAQRLDIERDNRATLELMQRVDGSSVSSIIALLEDYRDEMEEIREASRRTEQVRLAEDYHISGSAVIAMPESAANWEEKEPGLRKEFDCRLKHNVINLSKC